MAYNNYYPATYNPNYGTNPYYQQLVAQQQQMAAQQVPVQRNGFVPIPSEQDARAYPVAPGNSIMFRDESKPYCYVKTMGYSQLDQPVFEKYRLVKEDTDNSSVNAPNSPSAEKQGKDITYAAKEDLEAVWREIEAIKERLTKGAENNDA